MQGKESREDALFRPDEWWTEQTIELMTRTSVLKLDRDARVAKLSNKEEIEFDKALLATGSNVRRLNVGGCDLDGIHYLRTFGNSEAIKADAKNVERVVLIGGSYIGTEVAASLTLLGKKCSIVMQEDVTLERFYGEEVGRFFQGVLEEHGIEVHGGDELERFEGSDGRVGKVVTKAGKELDADMVVIGAGVAPDVSLAKGAGLEIGEGGGVKCSSTLESSVPGIWAAGDICEYDSPVHGSYMRIEHWDVAFNHGKTAALNMMGKPTEHDVVPYFFSDLADWVGYEYVGPGSGETVIRGSMDDANFTVFYLGDDGAVKAALTVGRSDDLEHATRFVKEKTAPDRQQLADEGTDLADL
jgi:3-phenylpropionate/trans-cinnamate dioxygenase ferredoxin reductase component